MLHIQTNCAAKGIISVHCRRPVKQASLCFYSLPPSPFMLNLLQHPFIVSLPGSELCPSLFFYLFIYFLSGRCCSAALRLLRQSVTQYWLKVKTRLHNYCQNIKHAFLNSKRTKQCAWLQNQPTASVERISLDLDSRSIHNCSHLYQRKWHNLLNRHSKDSGVFSTGCMSGNALSNLNPNQA